MESNSRDDSLNSKLAGLLKIASVEELLFEDAAGHCSDLIDLSTDLGEVTGLELAIELLREIHTRDLTSKERTQIFYFEGNAWSSLDQLVNKDGESAWCWDREKAERALLAFRRSISEPEFDEQPGSWRSRVYTNLANTLNKNGRFVLAGPTYAQARAADREFGMPCVNRSISLWHYALNLYDPGHKRILLWHANEQMTSALRMVLEPGVAEKGREFLKKFEDVSGTKFLNDPLGLKEYSLGDSDDESRYRSWCLKNALFLNPLNDCFAESIAAADVLHLPDMVRPFAEGPGLHGFFNQIKQEYVSARYFLFEAIHNDEIHFSDLDVKLVDVLDYASFGLASEKGRWAFRSAASIMDKVAVFIAWYFGLSGSNGTSFRKVWYKGGKPESGLRKEFTALENWPLGGLYWLSKDLYETSICGEDLEPEVGQFRKIRNGLEHRYVKILVFDPPDIDGDPAKDNYAISVKRDLFERMALQYLQHAREAIIYLSLGIHQDQVKNQQGKGDLSIPMILPEVNDDWKF